MSVRSGCLDRQTLTCVLIDHHQEPQLAAIFGAIDHEVVRPDMVDPFGPTVNATGFATARQAAAMLFSRHLHGLALTADSASQRLSLAAAGRNGAETGEVHDRIRFVAEWHPSVADLKMRLLGLEPRTYGLKVRCSTD